MMDTRRRWIVKAMIWNMIGLASMALVGFVATGSWGVGGRIALANAVIGLCFYLIYERIWAGIRWGRHV